MAKKIYCFLEIFLIFAVFLIPSFLVSSDKVSEVNFRFSWMTLIQYLIAMFLYLQHRKMKISSPFFEKNEAVKLGFFSIFITIITTYFYLLITTSVLNVVFQNLNVADKQKEIFTEKSASFFAITTIELLAAAFFEEVIYRQFLCEGFYYIFSVEPFKNNKKSIIFTILIETSVAFVFAFGHRYLGIFGIVNALFCHFILRGCYLKTNSIFCSSFVHFLYNFTSILTYFFVNN